MTRPKAKQCPCAACGAPKTERKTTFLIGYGRHAGEYYICKKCWSCDANDEAWNDKITQRIYRRGKARELSRAAELS